MQACKKVMPSVESWLCGTCLYFFLRDIPVHTFFSSTALAIVPRGLPERPAVVSVLPALDRELSARQAGFALVQGAVGIAVCLSAGYSCTNNCAKCIAAASLSAGNTLKPADSRRRGRVLQQRSAMFPLPALGVASLNTDTWYCMCTDRQRNVLDTACGLFFLYWGSCGWVKVKSCLSLVLATSAGYAGHVLVFGFVCLCMM